MTSRFHMRRSLLPALCLFGFTSLYAQSPSGQQFVVPANLKVNATSTTPASAFSGNLGVGDFNADGRKDILALYTPANGSSEYAVLLAQVNDSYTPKLTGISTDQNSVQVADVNNDGRADLVIVTQAQAGSKDNPCADPGYPCGDSILGIYLGNGDGTFHLSSSTTAAAGLFATIGPVTDLNHDGKRDLIVNSFSPSNPNTNTVWINQGNGTFKSAESFAGNSPVAYGDFNGDGYTDLVMPGIQILLNQGGTSFKPGATYPFQVQAIAAGDMNRDGKMDLVFADATGIDNNGHVLLGNGDGTFRTSGTFSFGPTATRYLADFVASAVAIFIADVNRDGEPDICLSSNAFVRTGVLSDTNLVQVFPGNGNGTVGFPVVYNVGNTSPQLLDLNNNGRFDLLLAGSSSSSYSLATNDGKGNFNAPRQTEVFVPGAIVEAQFDKTTRPDIAVVSYPPSATFTTAGKASVVVFPETGQGYFGPAKSYVIGMPEGVIATGDVNRDGKLDIVVARSAQSLPINTMYPGTDLSVLLGNGDGTFRQAMDFSTLGNPPTTTKDNFIALADVNHDGKLDLIGDWGVALGKGDGSFDTPIPLPASTRGFVTQISGGDFNHDGVLDLAVGVSSYNSSGTGAVGTVYILLGNGKGSFTIKGQAQLGGTTQINALTVADMNSDGKPDLIIESPQFLTIRLGVGDGSFAAPMNYPLGPTSALPGRFLVADFNRDGRPDLLYQGVFGIGLSQPGKTPGGPITLWYGIGGGKLSATPQYYPTALAAAEIVTDLNGDVALDIAGTTAIGITRLLNAGNRAPVTK
jgi:hypothetical protein